MLAPWTEEYLPVACDMLVVRVSAGVVLRPRIPGVRVFTPIIRKGLNIGLDSGGQIFSLECIICVAGRRECARFSE